MQIHIGIPSTGDRDIPAREALPGRAAPGVVITPPHTSAAGLGGES